MYCVYRFLSHQTISKHFFSWSSLWQMNTCPTKTWRQNCALHHSKHRLVHHETVITTMQQRIMYAMNTDNFEARIKCRFCSNFLYLLHHFCAYMLQGFFHFYILQMCWMLKQTGVCVPFPYCILNAIRVFIFIHSFSPSFPAYIYFILQQNNTLVQKLNWIFFTFCKRWEGGKKRNEAQNEIIIHRTT